MPPVLIAHILLRAGAVPRVARVRLRPDPIAPRGYSMKSLSWYTLWHAWRVALPCPRIQMRFFLLIGGLSPRRVFG